MITNYAANNVLNAMCGKSQFATLGATSYLALCATEPTASSTTVDEPNKNGYARILLGNYNQAYTQMMSSASSGAITNNQEIHFNEVTSADDNTGWGTLSYACIFSAASGGSLLAWGELGTTTGGVWTAGSISPATNNVVVIKQGDLNISIV